MVPDLRLYCPPDVREKQFALVPTHVHMPEPNAAELQQMCQEKTGKCGLDFGLFDKVYI